ncbi:phage tail protein [Paenibacillus sp. EKM211P]|uniref:phage tail protein n=1 Tax=Paenibacillus sp. EKM211P TaxID=1683679 RepID=UPI001EEC230F|nr:phage tail protein [Paenibacillus sp. EKM211P]
MSIQQPRRFVTTDQGHADVLNVPIDTLYANDQGLAAQVENIKKDPAGNGVASKEALDSHASNTDLHVTAAKQAAWSAAEGNAKKYTEQYAAPKQHSHPASDLPSASTQARGIVQLNTSTSSTATDQAATPSAVKAMGDELRQLINNIKEAGSVKSVQRLVVSLEAGVKELVVNINPVNSSKTMLSHLGAQGYSTDDGLLAMLSLISSNQVKVTLTNIYDNASHNVSFEVIEFN